jgi:glycosyltransferase involved in cell wall biosynthesis
MFVFNEVSYDRRVLKEADALQAAGWSVTIHGIRQRRSKVSVREDRTSGVVIIRHPQTVFPATPPAWNPAWRLAFKALFAFQFIFTALPALAGIRVARQVRSAFALWAWAVSASHATTQAGILHAHDLSGGLPALLASDASGASIVYDSHEVFLESGRWAKSPGFIRRALATQFEQPVLRRAAALIAVNPQVIEELAKRYEIPERQVAIYNCPSAWNPGPPGTELRAAIGVDAAAQVVLYHGGFSAHRGLEELLEAKRDPRLANAHLVFLGYGPLEPTLRAAAANPAYGGRVHVLEAVSPEVLDRWVSGADVGMCTVLPSTLNHRISTPNKLFESIGAGVPVIASDFATMRNIVLGDPDGPLGAVCDPTNSREVATAIHSILSMSPGDRAALRARCIRAAAARWNWEAQAAHLTELYRSLPPTTSA